jgi:hypothetical protein
MRLLAGFQGIYYLITGLWPVVDIDSFQAVTGDKTDLWLVKTVGLLIAVIGAAIFRARNRPALHPEILILAAGSALALGTIDVAYSLRGVISKVYLLDAPVEAALVAGWVVIRARQRAATTSPPR